MPKLRFLAIILLLALPLFIWLSISSLPTPWKKAILFSVKVLDKQGQELRLFTTSTGYWRFPVNLNKIDKNFISALIHYEDKRFYQHTGIDFYAIFRAIKQLLLNSKVISGASTLSMQTIRLLNPHPRTIINKLYEMLQATRMESDLSKDEILAIYLTLTPYGGNIQGIEAASYFYFGKSAKFLSHSEIALLIALPQSPEKRRPDRHKAQALIARNTVLLRQLKNHLISTDDYRIARQQEIPSKRFKTPFYAPHVAQNLHHKYPSKTIINTSIELPLQILLEQKIKQYRANMLMSNKHSKQSLAVMIVDNSSRKIIAHIGSGDFFNDSQLDLSRVIRSPGSTLKPFIYGLGFEKKLFHPLTKVMDQRLRYDDGYSPENFNKIYFGEVNIKKSLLKSLNIPAVKALHVIGVKTFLQRLRSVGIAIVLPKNSDAGLGIALGGSGLSLEQLVAMYSSLANSGKYQALSYLRKPDHRANKALLSPLAVSYIDAILKNMPQKKHLGQQKIRYKTGTSYGYRDAWSIGYNGKYTIGVWVGRADGGFTHKQTGSQVASPLLKQLFDVFNTKNPVKISIIPDANANFLNHYSDLPQQMQWLGSNDTPWQKTPYILYPLDGSKIEINVKDTAEKNAKANSAQLTFKARGGSPPYFWMLDGIYINHFSNSFPNNSQNIQWPISQGKHKITLIDSLGKQSHSLINVKIITP